MEELAGRIGEELARKRYNSIAALTKWSFNRLLWNEKGGYLYDVVNGGPPDDGQSTIWASIASASVSLTTWTGTLSSSASRAAFNRRAPIPPLSPVSATRSIAGVPLCPPSIPFHEFVRPIAPGISVRLASSLSGGVKLRERMRRFSD